MAFALAYFGVNLPLAKSSFLSVYSLRTARPIDGLDPLFGQQIAIGIELAGPLKFDTDTDTDSDSDEI